MNIEGLKIDEVLARSVITGTVEGLQMSQIVPEAVGLSRFESVTRDLSVIVGVHGTSIGNITMNISERAAVIIASRMLGEPLDHLDEDAIDAICEIGNMVAGRLKELLRTTPYEFLSISLPALVFGGNYNLYHLKNITTVSVTFEIKEVSIVHVLDKFFSTSISLLGRSGQ